MTTKTHLLYHAFDVPNRDLDDYEVPEGTMCAITGEPLSVGVEANSLLTSASSAPHEIFPNDTSEYVSWEAAQCYKYFRGGLTGNLLARDRDWKKHLPEGHKPMVSTSSARRKDRPNWQKLLYGTDPHASLKPGDTTVAIFTEEFQRRLWLDATMSTVGPHWKPHLFSGSTRRTLEVSFEDLREVLALCEYVYTLGFTKQQLQSSLVGAQSKMGLLTTLGLPRVKVLDNALAEWRDTDELKLAAFCCQRAGFDPLDDYPDQIEALDAPKEYTCLIPTPTTSSTASTMGPATTSSESQSPQKTLGAEGERQMGLFS